VNNTTGWILSKQKAFKARRFLSVPPVLGFQNSTFCPQCICMFCVVLRTNDCATTRKVAGSFPDGVIGTLHWHNLSSRAMASNRSEYQDYFLGGKGGQCVGLTILPPSHAGSLEIWGPQPAGTLLGLSVPVHDLFYFFLLYLRTNREFCPKQRS